MPELPEVETVVRTLEHLIQGRQITAVKALYPKIISGQEECFIERLQNQHFNQFLRRGKYLIFQMDDCYLVAHLRMEGKFYLRKKEEPWDKHTHLLFYLTDGSRLDYHDTRKFGRMELLELTSDLDQFKGLGPEPFSEAFNEVYIKEKVKNRNTPLKSMLMDQHFVAGIGNIYADEICFAMGLHPLTPVKRLTKPKRQQLIDVTCAILKKAIEAGGSTIRSYTSSLGVTGLFQLQIEVYGQENKPCPRCGTPIKKIKVAQRGSCFCPHCQRRR